MIWESAAGDYDYKVETKVCEGCRDCGGSPPVPGNAGDPPASAADEASEIDDLVTDIADIIAWEDAGFATDWDHYPFQIRALVKYWRAAERDVTAIRDTRMQAFLKSWFKEQ